MCCVDIYIYTYTYIYIIYVKYIIYRNYHNYVNYHNLYCTNFNLLARIFYSLYATYSQSFAESRSKVRSRRTSSHSKVPIITSLNAHANKLIIRGAPAYTHAHSARLYNKETP